MSTDDDVRVRTKFWVVWNPDGQAPTMRHWTRLSADTEAQRLASLHPDQDFFVLKAMAGRRGVEPKKPLVLTMIVDPIPF